MVFIISEQSLIHESKAGIEKELINNKLMIRNDYEPENITLDKIFNNELNESTNLDPKKKIEIIVTGDVLLARSVNYKTTSTRNFYWPFLYVASELRSADITFINLETPLVKNCPPTNQGMIFCGDPENIQGLIYAGVDVANIANNHIYNYGEKGVDETIKLLNENNITPAGLREPVYKRVKGKKVAFLGFSDFSSEKNKLINNENELRNKIYNSKLSSDIVIVQFHWGNEYTTKITPRQRFLAYLAIDSGADLVIGNHPHWIQPIEIYKGKLIAYSHGNLIFDQEWSRDTKLGIVGKYTFNEDKLIDAEYLPVKIENYGQPLFLEGEEKREVLNNLYNISKIL